MSCEICKDGDYLLAGEDWSVFIEGDVLKINVDAETYDYKSIQFCPNCGEPLTQMEPLSLETLSTMAKTDWVWVAYPRLSEWTHEWRRATDAYNRFSHELYSKTWVAYARKPRQGD